MEYWNNGSTITINSVAFFNNEMINPISLLSFFFKTLH